MTDRPVNLDLGVAPQLNMQMQSGSGQPSPSHSGQENAQLEQDAAKLQGLLKANELAPPPAPTATETPGGQQNLSPFDLFGASAQTRVDATHAHTPAHIPAPAPVREPERDASVKAELEKNIARMASSLMVGESRHGAIVRMELSRENLPGVVMEVFKNEGALVAQFICSNEQSRTRLARSVSWLGDSLSGRLNTDTLIRVQTDDPEDPYPVEARNRAAPV